VARLARAAPGIEADLRRRVGGDRDGAREAKRGRDGARRAADPGALHEPDELHDARRGDDARDTAGDERFEQREARRARTRLPRGTSAGGTTRAAEVAYRAPAADTTGVRLRRPRATGRTARGARR